METNFFFVGIQRRRLAAKVQSLQKRSLFPFVSLIVSLILAPNTWPATNTWSRQHQPSFRGYSRYQTPRLTPRTPDPATAFPNLILVQNEPPLVALSLPNAASESLQKRSLFPFVSLIVSLILAPNTWPATNTWSRQHQPSFRGYSRYQTPLLAPRTPDPATAFPNLILVKTSRLWLHFRCQTPPLNPYKKEVCFHLSRSLSRSS